MIHVPIEQIVVALGYLGIFLLMIANGAVSFPSSQILYIIVGYFVFTGALSAPAAILFGAIGNTIGCLLLYELARRKGYTWITQFKIFPKEIVHKVQIAFSRRGKWFVFIGKLIPALKVFVPIPAGIARMNRAAFIAIIFISSAIWAVPFIAIGYYFGKSSDVFGKYAIVLAIVALIALSLFYKYINSESIVREVEGEK